MTLKEILKDFEDNPDLLNEKQFKEIQYGTQYAFLIAFDTDELIIGVYRKK